MIFLSEFLDFPLEHSVCVNQGIISVFGFVDSHLKLFLDLFVGTHLFFDSGILGFFFLLFIIVIVFFLLRVLLILFFIFLMFGNILLAFVLVIMQRLEDHVRKFRILIVLILDKFIVVIDVTLVRIRYEQ